MSLLSLRAELVDLARRTRAWPSRRRARASYAQRRMDSPVGAPVLAFGSAAPKPGEIIHGGQVKLLHLSRAFAHNEERFNLLYLVSSAIPANARELVDWARRQGAKFVWNQNGTGFPAWAGAAYRSFNRPMADLLARADYVVYQSEFCRESANRWVAPAKAPAAVLPNPVDLAAFAPTPNPPSTDCWRLLTAGTHNQPYRVLGALETAHLLRQSGRAVHLVVAGERRWPGANREIREAIAKWQLEASVELLPAFTQTEAVELLRRSHILLHAKYADPCPTMVIEALACGIPVIGSRTGGLPELVGEDGGALISVPTGWERASYPSPAEMAAAVETLMAKWPERSRAARARAEQRFGAEQWLESHARIFEKALAP